MQKRILKKKAFKNTALLVLVFLATLPALFFSCSSSEKKSVRLEKLYNVLKFASQTQVELQKDTLDDALNSSITPNDRPDNAIFLDLVTLFQQGELETVAKALDEIIAKQINDEAVDQYGNGNSPAVGKRLEMLKNDEAIDFFSTLQTLNFFYDHFYLPTESFDGKPVSSG